MAVDGTPVTILYREDSGAAPRTVTALPGETLAAALVRAGIPVALRCGGHGRCGSCRVRLVAGRWRLPEGETELRAPGIVAAACRAFPLAGAAPGEVEALPGIAGILVERRFTPSWRPEEALRGSVAAVDLGTTTLAGVLIADGEAAAAAGIANAQIRFGDNVIDRIAAAEAGRGDELRRALLAESLDPLLAELVAAAGRTPARIVLAGNTAMSCFAAGIDAASLGRAPYDAPATVFPQFRAAELGLRAVAPETPVEVVPGAGSFIGGDTVAGLFAAGFAAGETDPAALPALFVDLGTNCETVLLLPDRAIAASAAAGPAFERRGTLAGTGAVIHLDLSPGGNFRLETAGDAPPSGLCGSAWLDLLVLLRRLGVIDEQGLFVPGERERRRWCAEREGLPGCRIATGITAIEADLAELITAKAAVAAAIGTLLDAAGVAPGALKLAVLAGGFALGSRPESLRGVGLLPLPDPVPLRAVGNACLAGAARLAALGLPMSALDGLRRRIEVVNLAETPEFRRRYIDALTLPGAL